MEGLQLALLPRALGTHPASAGRFCGSRWEQGLPARLWEDAGPDEVVWSPPLGTGLRWQAASRQQVCPRSPGESELGAQSCTGAVLLCLRDSTGQRASVYSGARRRACHLLQPSAERTAGSCSRPWCCPHTPWPELSPPLTALPTGFPAHPPSARTAGCSLLLCPTPSPCRATSRLTGWFGHLLPVLIAASPTSRNPPP